MTDQPHPPRPGSDRLPAVFATVTYLALVIAAFGFVSLITDTDVIDLTDAGPVVGPVMVLGASIATFPALVRCVHSRTPWVALVLAAAASYVTMLLVGGVAYALVRGQVLWVVLFAAREATSPYILTAATLSGLTVVALWAVSRGSALR